MDEKTQRNLGYWIVAVLIIASIQHWLSGAATVEAVPYSEFERYLKEGKIAEVLISDLEITGRLKTPPNGAPERPSWRGPSPVRPRCRSFPSTIVATRVEPGLADQLAKYGVRFTRVIETGFLRELLFWVIPAFVFFGVWFFLFRRFAEKQGLGGFMSIGKSRAKVYVEKDTGVTFENVAGVDEAKDELKEIVDFLKTPN